MAISDSERVYNWNRINESNFKKNKKNLKYNIINGRVLRGRRKWSKGTQKWWEDTGIREKRKWERKISDFPQKKKGSTVTSEIFYLFFVFTIFIMLSIKNYLFLWSWL